jgi:hypothetical protein
MTQKTNPRKPPAKPRKTPEQKTESARVLVTMPIELHLWCVELSEYDFKSVNTWLLDLARKEVAKVKKLNALEKQSRIDAEKPRL